jgi:hypothetical protein
VPPSLRSSLTSESSTVLAVFALASSPFRPRPRARPATSERAAAYSSGTPAATGSNAFPVAIFGRGRSTGSLAFARR